NRCGFTRDFEQFVAWLATTMDKSAICRPVRIDWDTVGRIIARVCADELDPERLENLYEIGIDEVSWKRQHNYLTLGRRSPARTDRVGQRRQRLSRC
ncbi:MAG: transposase family protein, partial [Solirubrobacterales bacterium]|nr:transposase family protein [Solirubrobacterales bacterium]